MHSTLYIKKDGKYKRVTATNILYLNADGSYLRLVTTTDDFLVPQNLTEFVQTNQLPFLIRVHRSYLVNLQQVDSFDQSYVYMGSHQIPIGHTYRNRFLEQLKSL